VHLTIATHQESSCIVEKKLSWVGRSAKSAGIKSADIGASHLERGFFLEIILFIGYKRINFC
jgi:hypothetical protein